MAYPPLWQRRDRRSRRSIGGILVYGRRCDEPRPGQGFPGYGNAPALRSLTGSEPTEQIAGELRRVLQAAKYSTIEPLRAGRRVHIRALTPADQADFLAAVGQTSAASLFRRFFSPKRGFTQQEIAFFLHADFIEHVALVAVATEGGRPVIVGGGRYIVEHPGQAEPAFLVTDRHQGQGIGSALLRHLAVIARGAGLKELTAQVLRENVAMLSVFDGFRVTGRAAGIVYLSLQLD
jgi:GNAT superfamily N-acetyltransferase